MFLDAKGLTQLSCKVKQRIFDDSQSGRRIFHYEQVIYRHSFT
jgi:hypothetical protein